MLFEDVIVVLDTSLLPNTSLFKCLSAKWKAI